VVASLEWGVGGKSFRKKAVRCAEKVSVHRKELIWICPQIVTDSWDSLVSSNERELFSEHHTELFVVFAG